MNNKNKLQVINNSLFSKFKRFLFKLFSKKNVKQTQVSYDYIQEPIDSFRENLSKDIIKNKNKDITYSLQKGLQSQNLKIQDLSNNELFWRN